MTEEDFQVTTGAAVDDDALRARARRRTWLCPGAGSALVGRPTLAMVSFLAAFAFLAALAWFSLQPTAMSLFSIVGLFVACGLISLVEFRVIKKGRLGAGAPAFLTRGFVVPAAAWWLAAVACLVVFFVSFGTIKMAGSTMGSTIGDGQRAAYHKRVDWNRVQPGAVIMFHIAEESAWPAPPDYKVISRILAGPGDELSVDNSRYVVNGSAGPQLGDTGDFDPVIDVPDSPRALTVPEDCYFMVQESPAGFDSRVLSWARRERIVATSLWHLDRRRFLQEIE